MDIQRKTCYSNLERTFISRHILYQHWYTCPIALLVRRNPQHRSLLTVLSHFRNLSRIICDFRMSLREFLDPSVNRFTRQTLPNANRKHFFMNILCTKSFCPQKKTDNRTLFSGTTLLKHGRHFDYWNKPPNMRMRVCYLDCHEAGLCCYPFILIENYITAVYFNLWPIYWLSPVGHYSDFLFSCYFIPPKSDYKWDSSRLSQEVHNYKPDRRRNVGRPRRRWGGQSLRRNRLIKAYFEVDDDDDRHCWSMLQLHNSDAHAHTLPFLSEVKVICET
jgi:hypothetical protein